MKCIIYCLDFMRVFNFNYAIFFYVSAFIMERKCGECISCIVYVYYVVIVILCYVMYGLYQLIT